MFFVKLSAHKPVVEFLGRIGKAKHRHQEERHCRQYGQNYAQPYDPPQGTKSRIAAGVLAILFGVFGVHNFYIGKTGLGIAQLAITVCSCGTLAIVSEIWGIIEGVRLLQGTIYTDGHGMKFVD